MSFERDLNQFIHAAIYELSRHDDSTQNYLLLQYNNPFQSKLLEIMMNHDIIHFNRGAWCLTRRGNQKARKYERSIQGNNLLTSNKASRVIEDKKKVINCLERCLLEELLRSGPCSIAELRMKNHQIHRLMSILEKEYYMKPIKFRFGLIKSGLVQAIEPGIRGQIMLTKKGKAIANRNARWQSIDLVNQETIHSEECHSMHFDAFPSADYCYSYTQADKIVNEDELISQFTQCVSVDGYDGARSYCRY